MPPHLPTTRPQSQATARRVLSAPAHTAVLARGDDPPEPPALPPGGTHPPGPPLGETHPPGPPFPLLFFGIVRPSQRPDVLLRALAPAPADVTFTVAAEFGGVSTEMDNLNADLGVADRGPLPPR